MSAAVSEWEKHKMAQKRRTKERLKMDAQKQIEEDRAKDEKSMQVSAALVAWRAEKRDQESKKREKKRLEMEAKKEVEKKKQAAREEADMVLLTNTSFLVFLVDTFKSILKFIIQ